MAELCEHLILGIGDLVQSRNHSGELYGITGWPDDPNIADITLRSYQEGNLTGRNVNYYKHYLNTGQWYRVSTPSERLLSLVAHHIKLLGRESQPDIHELLVRLEV
jgi:hypothetical protein